MLPPAVQTLLLQLLSCAPASYGVVALTGTGDPGDRGGVADAGDRHRGFCKYPAPPFLVTTRQLHQQKWNLSPDPP